ncbi:hypothetical protein M9435_004402 [Picochlorum sp. BPE23]|nr:hypothetical protein M9435_004402 [Picochlorum sp. BPE23]
MEGQSSILKFFKPVLAAQPTERQEDPLPDSNTRPSPSIEKDEEGAQSSPCTSAGVETRDGESTRCSSPEGHKGACDFEKERMRRIERNREIMKQLGLGHGGGAMPNMAQAMRTKRKKKTQRSVVTDWNNRENPAMPLRRSKRHSKNSQDDDVDDKENKSEVATVTEKVYEDSNVLKYMVDMNTPSTVPISCLRESSDDTNMMARTFREERVCMFDSRLARCYSLDYWQNGHLVCGGGKNGHATVFSCDKVLMKDGDSDDIEPLISQKLHRGWICDVGFVQGGDSMCPNLLTAGNDGVFSVWDLNMQDEISGDIKQTYVNDTLHNGSGIFSMHYSAHHGLVLSGAKDGSIALFDMTTTSLEAMYEDVHDGGVVKCVRWRRPDVQGGDDVFASCGNDGKTRIHDRRMKAAACASFTGSSVVNTVMWCPSNEHMLLSAGNDSLDIMDIRSPTNVMHSFRGHNDHGSSGIYQPVFVNNGASVLTAGSGKSSQCLTLFDVQKGEMISKGDVGWSIGASHVIQKGNTEFIMFSGPRKVSFFSPFHA